MQIFLDLEKTLLNDNTILTKKSYNFLKSLGNKHELFILSMSSISFMKKKMKDIPCTLISALENQTDKIDNPNKLDKTILNSILKNYPIYTAFTIWEKQTLIFSYKERLKSFFYPGTHLKLINRLEIDPTFIVLILPTDILDNVVSQLKEYSISILGKDSKRTILHITKASSTKESWLLKLKKSPAIGIGDSLSDYNFIKHCETQVAMKNGDGELKKLCSYQTELTNNEDGAISFLANFLKLQPF